MNNPYRRNGLWYWNDAAGRSHGPYDIQVDALRALLKHVDPFWQRVQRELMRFIRS